MIMKGYVQRKKSFRFGKNTGRQRHRLISVKDVRNYFSHIIYIFIFYFFVNFLLFVRLQTPTSNKMLEEGIMVSERQVIFNVNL